MQTVEWRLAEGDATVHLLGALERRDTPVVLLFTDAFGPRAATFRIAEQIARDGHRVAVPDLFYREKPCAPLDPASVFGGGEDRDRLGAFLAKLDQRALDGDVSALLDHCRENTDGDARLGAAGYCMGGRYALTAASLGIDVAAAACFHSSNLAPASGDSAHTRLAGSATRIYVGIAEIDPTFDAAEEGRLAEALRAAGTDHAIESYPGANHGFAMQDLPVYSPSADARHLRRLRSLFAETLSTTHPLRSDGAHGERA